MDFWKNLVYGLNKRADFDAHKRALQEHTYGSQIAVPGQTNDKIAVPESFHQEFANLAKNHHMAHSVVQGHGGWSMPEGAMSVRGLPHRTQIEPISYHRFYGSDPNHHVNLRDTMLPKIQKDLQQDASLGVFDSNQQDDSAFGDAGRIRPFSLYTLRGRAPVVKNLDFRDTPYMRLLENIGDTHGGFSHFVTPSETQLEVHSENPEKFNKTMQDIDDYFQKNHGVGANFSVDPAKAYLYTPSQEQEQLKTASVKGNTLCGPVRNVLHCIHSAANDGDAYAQELFNNIFGYLFPYA